MSAESMGGFNITEKGERMNTETGFKSAKWREYLWRLKNKDLTPDQEKCHHSYSIVPKSGYHFGHSLWRCIYCETVVESS